MLLQSGEINETVCIVHIGDVPKEHAPTVIASREQRAVWAEDGRVDRCAGVGFDLGIVEESNQTWIGIRDGKQTTASIQKIAFLLRRSGKEERGVEPFIGELKRPKSNAARRGLLAFSRRHVPLPERKRSQDEHTCEDHCGRPEVAT